MPINSSYLRNLSITHLRGTCPWLLKSFLTLVRKHCSIFCLVTRVQCGPYYSVRDAQNTLSKGHGLVWEKDDCEETLTSLSPPPTFSVALNSPRSEIIRLSMSTVIISAMS